MAIVQIPTAMKLTLPWESVKPLTLACRQSLFLALGMGLVLSARPADADRIELDSGEVIEGKILEVTRNTVTISGGQGIRPASISRIERIGLDLADGTEVEGALIGYKDGSFELDAGEDVIRILAEDRVVESDVGDAGQAVAKVQPDQTVRQTMTARPKISLSDGTTFTGDIIHTTGSVVTVRRDDGGAGLVPRTRIAAVSIATENGEIEGELLSWTDGIYHILSDGQEVLASENGISDEAASAVLQAVVTPEPSPLDEAEDQSLDAALVPPAADDAERDDAAGVEAEAGREADPVPAEAVGSTPEPLSESTDDVDTSTSAIEDAAADTQVAALPKAHMVASSVEPVTEDSEAVVFELRLDRPSEQPLVVLYAATDDTAKAGQDFEPRSGVVTFDPGSDYAEIRVPLIDDQDAEQQKSFRLFLSGDPEAVQFQERQVIATINDND